jgi:hypothetical protein
VKSRFRQLSADVSATPVPSSLLIVKSTPNRNYRGRLKQTCDNSNQHDMSSKPSLRAVLAESHVSDVAIAALLLRSFITGIKVLGPPMTHASVFVCTAIAIRDVPYFTVALNARDRLELVPLLGNLISCLAAAVSAWTLSRWMYSAGPFRSLSQRVNALRRSRYV